MILPMRVRVCAYVCNYGRVREETIQNVGESKFQGFCFIIFIFTQKSKKTSDCVSKLYHYL